MPRRGDDGRTLTTVLFTDIVGSTELASELGDLHWKQVLATHHGVVRKTLRRYNGHEVDTAGDGFFATFSRPADAIRCASDIIDQLRAIGIHIRAGVHMGEVERMGATYGGIAVHIGARVAAKAGADEILVSSTVRDLVSGSDIRFENRGAYDLKGVPGQWNLLAVERTLEGDIPDRPLVEAPAAKAARRRSVPTVAIVVAAIAVVALAAVGVVAIVVGGSGGLEKVDVPGPNTLSLINVRSNRFDGTVEVGKEPADAAPGNGSIWVLNTADSTFSQVDSATGKTLSTPRSVGGTPTGIAFGAGSIWISTEFGGVGGEPGSVLRFDLSGGGAKNVIRVGNGVASIAFGDGSVWVTNTISNTLSRIDPNANAIVQTWRVGDSPQGVVAGGGAVWVANTLDNSVWKIDENSNKVVTRVTVLQPPSSLTLDGKTLWVVSETGNTVSEVDTTTGTTETTISVGAQPLALVAGTGGIWVIADQGHDVERIDAVKQSVTVHLRVGGSPEGIAMDGARVWVSVTK